MSKQREVIDRYLCNECLQMVRELGGGDGSVYGPNDVPCQLYDVAKGRVCGYCWWAVTVPKYESDFVCSSPVPAEPCSKCGKPKLTPQSTVNTEIMRNLDKWYCHCVVIGPVPAEGSAPRNSPESINRLLDNWARKEVGMEKCAICKRYHFPGNNCEEATEAETTPSTETASSELVAILRMFVYYEKQVTDKWIIKRSLYGALKQWRETTPSTERGWEAGAAHVFQAYERRVKELEVQVNKWKHIREEDYVGFQERAEAAELQFAESREEVAKLKRRIALLITVGSQE